MIFFFKKKIPNISKALSLKLKGTAKPNNPKTSVHETHIPKPRMPEAPIPFIPHPEAPIIFIPNPMRTPLSRRILKFPTFLFLEIL